MNPFTTTREAKEFLIVQIVDEATREGTPLNDIERRMLYFTETAWMPEDTWQASEIFDRDYDQDAYEYRMAQLIKNLKQNPQYQRSQWHDAIKMLSCEDHYLLVLINTHPGTPFSGRPKYDRLKLFLTAFAIIALALVAMLFYHHFFDR